MTAGSEYETSLETRAAQELKTAFNRVTTAEQELKEEHHLAPSVLFRSLDLSQYTHTHTHSNLACAANARKAIDDLWSS